MKGIATEKVSGGKLVRIKLTFDNDRIYSLQITGDFFLHPEEKLKEIEDIFIGRNIFFDEKNMEDEIQIIIEKNQMTLVGITPEAIIKATKNAITNANDGHNVKNGEDKK